LSIQLPLWLASLVADESVTHPFIDITNSSEINNLFMVFLGTSFPVVQV